MVTQAVFAIAPAAVRPLVHSGDKPMFTCVFGGGVASVPNPNVTPVDRGVGPLTVVQALAVLSHVCSAYEFAGRLTKTRARVNCDEARIFASPTRFLTESASPLRRFALREVSVIGTAIAQIIPMIASAARSSMSVNPSCRVIAPL